jgi:predicted AlkP superfamily pyrophosphatase or phosphodiesterase
VVRIAAGLVAIALAFGSAPQPRSPDPILILISFDGWRWDYLDRVHAPNLKALAARGVRASELIPVFPTLTFPNHYTIATGLRPAHHGIISNSMAEPGFAVRFSMSAPSARDPRWWGGEPIWVTAIRQGRKAAAMFWPGTDVAIGGVQTSYWWPFDDKFPNVSRAAQVLDWLARPPGEQPSLITVYFSDVDHAGHDYGPESREVREAAGQLDEMLGLIVDGVHRLGLSDRTTIVVVSDHGMTPVSDGHLVLLDDIVDLSSVDVIDWDWLLQIAPRHGSVDALYRELRRRARHLAIYTRENLPGRLHYRDNPRIPPIVGLPEVGWTVTSRARLRAREEDNLPPRRGGHGYDPRVRDMHAMFVAAGPRLRSGYVAAPFENIHLYEFLCAALKLSPAKNDGDPTVTRGFFAAP